MNLRKKVKSSSLYTEYINILNGVLQLSKRESEVLSFMLAADANGEHENVNAKHIRQAIMNHLSISESNLSRYLNTLKSKGLLVRSPTNNKWIINENIRPDVTSGILELTITLDTNEGRPGQTNKAFSKKAQ
jgi:hypothetical protein